MLGGHIPIYGSSYGPSQGVTHIPKYGHSHGTPYGASHGQSYGPQYGQNYQQPTYSSNYGFVAPHRQGTPHHNASMHPYRLNGRRILFTRPWYL